MTRVVMRTEATVEVDLDMLARLFAELDDDAQAQFFVKVAAILDASPATQWTNDVARWQAEHIGRHLAECSPSARRFVDNIHESMADAMRSHQEMPPQCSDLERSAL